MNRAGDKVELVNFIKNNPFIEYAWRGNNLMVWIPFSELQDFVSVLGYNYLSDGGLDVNLQSNDICFAINDLCEYFGVYAEDIESKIE